jgi:hypothetical protein
MYGLPRAGKLASDRLVTHFGNSRCVQAKRTPGLFTHADRPIIFSLVVDDFGVQYAGREHQRQYHFHFHHCSQTPPPPASTRTDKMSQGAGSDLSSLVIPEADFSSEPKLNFERVYHDRLISVAVTGSLELVLNGHDLDGAVG